MLFDAKDMRISFNVTIVHLLPATWILVNILHLQNIIDLVSQWMSANLLSLNHRQGLAVLTASVVVLLNMINIIIDLKFGVGDYDRGLTALPKWVCVRFAVETQRAGNI